MKLFGILVTSRTTEQRHKTLCSLLTFSLSLSRALSVLSVPFWDPYDAGGWCLFMWRHGLSVRIWAPPLLSGIMDPVSPARIAGGKKHRENIASISMLHYSYTYYSIIYVYSYTQNFIHIMVHNLRNDDLTRTKAYAFVFGCCYVTRTHARNSKCQLCGLVSQIKLLLYKYICKPTLNIVIQQVISLNRIYICIV